MKIRLVEDDLKNRARLREMSDKSLGIEEQSMKIIDSEIGFHEYGDLEWPIVRRVIHATADFDFAKENKIIFSSNALKSVFNAFEKKCTIVVDVDMVLSGINKRSLSQIGLNSICNISSIELIKKSQKTNITRSALAMRHSYKEIEGGIVAIGNAPTALFEVIRMVNEGAVNPALIVGMPVGFVSAVESKDELSNTRTEFITNIGRKGGSAATSSVINALMLLYIHYNLG